MRQLGTHLLVELVGCKFELLNDRDAIQQALFDSAEKARATVLDMSFHKFIPQGVTGVLLLAESHMSFHSWPEEGYAALDVFTCGDQAMPQRAVEELIRIFAPEHFQIQEIKRGVPANATLTSQCKLALQVAGEGAA